MASFRGETPGLIEPPKSIFQSGLTPTARYVIIRSGRRGDRRPQGDTYPSGSQVSKSNACFDSGRHHERTWTSGRAALREQPADLRLVTEREKYLAIEKDTFPADLDPLSMTDAPPPLGVPEIAAVRLASDRAAERRNAELVELATLRERVTDLEAEVAHLHRQIDAAREAGRRDEREVKARTMGGQVLSIFVGGGR